MFSISFQNTMAVFAEKASSEIARFEGIYFYDTRFLSHYVWNFEHIKALARLEPKAGAVSKIYTTEACHEDTWAIRRTFQCEGTGFTDTVQLDNYGLEPHRFELTLSAAADFSDLMKLRLSTVHYEHPVVKQCGPFEWTAKTRVVGTLNQR